MKLKLNNNPKIGLGDNLPYIPLEYIESTGTQWIDTNYIPTINIYVELSFTVVNRSNGSGIFGTQNSSNDPAVKLYYQSTQSNCFRFGNKSTAAVVLPEHNVISFNKNGITINDTFYSNAISQFSTNINTSAYIFYINGLTTATNKFVGKLYNCKIYDNGTIVRDFIPCKDSNGVVCLYDTVSETFFYNSGTGNFIAGPEFLDVSDRFKLKCTDLFVKNCPNVNQIDLLKAILDTSGNTLSRIRINANNDVLTLSQAQQLLSMNGFNDSMQEQVKPRIVGSITINDYLTQEILTQLQNTLDGCTITAPNLIYWNEIAVQTLDSTKPNYNPAVAIILNNNSKGTVISSPVVEGGGRYFLTKTQAAAITSIENWFKNVSSATDSNNIVNTEEVNSYNLTSFNEFELFTGIVSLVAGDGNASGGSGPLTMPLCTSIKLPTSLTTLKGNAYGYSLMAAQSVSLISIDLKNIALIRDNGADFNGCTSLTEVTIGDNTTKIPAYEFRNCSNLTTINNFNDNGNITAINSNAFEGCSKLEHVELPQTVTSVGNGAFASCRGLKNIVFPESVTSFGTNIFNGSGEAAGIANIYANVPALTPFWGSNGCYFKEFNAPNCGVAMTHTGTPNLVRFCCKDFKTYSAGNFGVYPPKTNMVEILGQVYQNNTSCYLFRSNQYHAASVTLHLGYEGIACAPALISNDINAATWLYIYVGDGSSQAHDNEILQTYLADSAWSAYSNRLDTWYNYLQSQNS